jgi:L-fucono-1,5-lactonase
MTPQPGLVDAHVHLGSPDRAAYPRGADFPQAPELTGTIEEFESLAAGHGVTQGVLIQPSQYGFDHSYLRDCLARRPAGFTGVALADPGDPGAPEMLAGLVRDAAVTGIRLGPNFNDGRDWLGLGGDALLARASDLGVVTSLFIRPAHFAAVERWLDEHPGLVVVIDHLGRPDLADGDPMEAARALGRLARFPGIYVKVSALPAMSREPHPHRDTWPWAREAERAFGAGRLMWGSDFPLTAGRDTYARALEVIALALDHLAPQDRDRLMAGTAREVYRLPSQEGAHENSC